MVVVAERYAASAAEQRRVSPRALRFPLTGSMWIPSNEPIP
jgi:hypothetical protein